MSLRISNVRLGIDTPEAELPRRLATILGVRPDDLLSWRILRKSLDARDKRSLQFVYSAEVVLPGGAKHRAAHPVARAEPFN